jgi:methyl-accepting chemotaxis protein
MAKTPFVSTLSGRLALFGVLPTMAVIVAIIAWESTDAYRNLKRTAEQLLASDAGGAAAELSVRNDRWNNIAATLALGQTHGLFGRRKESLEVLRAVNALSDLSLSAYIVYEPNADGQDAESLKAGELPRESMDATGRFVPVWHDVIQAGGRTGADVLKPAVGMDSLDFYLGPKNTFRKGGKPAAVITEPYESEGELVVSHSFPIVVRGEFAGVAGVNRGVDALARIIGAIKERTQADVFIISGGGRFIAATTDAAGQEAGATALRLRPVSETPYATIAARWKSSLAGGDAEVFWERDPVLGVESLYAVEKSLVGDWTVVARRTKADIMQAADVARTRNIAMGGVGVVVIGSLLFFVTRSVSRRVRAAVEVADRIARGDLTQTVAETASGDEAGQLIRSMGTMDANLNALVGSVKQASIRLNSTATEIAATSKQQEATASTFGAASSQIAAAVKEISATSKDLVRTMESVSQNAAETAALAGAGQTSLQGMGSVMNDLDRATASISEKLSAINERSQKITTVITTITKVADQTNILSINAAIEAEKAGEFGSGFLVIAREIRRLADQTASATLDIEQMVQQMQAAVSSGVMEMDRFSDQVRRGVRDVASAGSQLTEIIDRVNRSTGSFKQVNESMQSQSQGAQQISEAMTSLSANAHQTMQSVQEFGRASADLQSAIATLRQAVGQFQLKE